MGSVPPRARHRRFHTHVFAGVKEGIDPMRLLRALEGRQSRMGRSAGANDENLSLLSGCAGCRTTLVLAGLGQDDITMRSAVRAGGGDCASGPSGVRQNAELHLGQICYSHVAMCSEQRLRLIGADTS